MSEKRHLKLRWPALGVLLLTLVGLAPFLSVLLSIAVARLCGCALDEGGTHLCLVYGHDIGETLYVMFVLGWLQLLTWPLVAVAALGWLALAVVALRRALR